MRVGVPKEIITGERRVALTPETVTRLVGTGIDVVIEEEAGNQSFFSNAAYESAGAIISSDTSAIFSQAEIILKVRGPVMNQVLNKHEADLLNEGSTLIAFLDPSGNQELIKQLGNRKITSLSMDAIPRIARAQSMDALSSMSSISGYKAALLAANALGKFFPLMMTAAGTVAPARGLVLGAGVAGLQAIATSRRLGAVMQAFDVRPTVREQVQSLGATFLEIGGMTEEAEDKGGYARELAEETQRQERALIHEHIRQTDFLISTALIPGKPAPTLITEEMVLDMKPGSIIIDLAAEAGGNCALTEPGAIVEKHGVLINGPLNLPSSMPTHASQMYSRNISSLLLYLIDENRVKLDFEDAVTQACCITHDGHIMKDHG